MKKKYNDYGMLFERIVEKVWGKPKTHTTFAGFYNLAEGKIILYGLCTYILNYQSPDDNLKDIINEFLDDKNYLNQEEFDKILEFLGEKFNL